MPTVTIGLPVYNGEQFVRLTLEAVLNQTFGDFELLIGDNASTDSTLAICSEFAARDQRVRVLRSDANQGAAPNYNRLVRSASGKYFKWLPHDDLIAPAYLERCVGYLEAHPETILCYPQTVDIDEHGDRLDRDPEDTLDVTDLRPSIRFRQYIESSYTNRQCNAVLGVIRTAVLRETRLIAPYVASDKVLLAELALRGPFHQIKEELFFRRYHATASLSLHPEPDARDRWFDTGKRTPRLFVHWNWFTAHLASIHLARLSPAQSVACYAQMWRYMRLYRYNLKDELKDILRSKVHRPVQKDSR
jgi:glycosyltransferase involved in cell wall biosynthesis